MRTLNTHRALEDGNNVEKRKLKRVSLRRDVILNDAIRAQALNLSAGGMFIYTSHSFPVGQSMTVSFALGEGRIRAKAIVRHCQEGVGVGLSFVSLDGEESASIRRFVDSVSEKTEKGAGDGRKRVLLVEDNPLSRKMNRSRLVLDGFTVFEAADGVEALNVLGAEEIDLVVLDLLIPKLDGYKVLSIIRENPMWKEIPVIVCSARTSPQEVQKAMAAGATEFLVKITTAPAKLSQRIKARLKA